LQDHKYRGSGRGHGREAVFQIHSVFPKCRLLSVPTVLYPSWTSPRPDFEE
jgi:hypothetical protein